VSEPSIWAVVAAAGSGNRFSSVQPKQFFPLVGSTVAELTLQRLLAVPKLAGLVVVRDLAEPAWAGVAALQAPLVSSAAGGAARVDSVLAGLRALEGRAAADDWVLVHDIARPCVTGADIVKLLAAAAASEVGAILATPVVETLKRVDGGAVVETPAREDYWLAQTPQLFRYQLLLDALRSALAAGVAVTDEASAVEAAGHPLAVVAGRADNIKITVAEQLPMAAAILAAQQQEPL